MKEPEVEKRRACNQIIILVSSWFLYVERGLVSMAWI
jgi:hypothetical protein